MGLIITRGLGIDIIYKSVHIQEFDTKITYDPELKPGEIKAGEVKELELLAIYTKKETEE